MKSRILGLALLIGVAVLLASCSQPTSTTNTSSGIVQAGDTVSVDYVGSFTNGTVFDSSAIHGPLNITVGSHQVIPGFENALLGMKVNQTKTITLPPAQAYGEYNASRVVTVPLANFGQDPSNYTGRYITVTTATGQPLQAKVVSVNETASVANQTNQTNATPGTVTLDLNHPLAGKTLVFNITVLSDHKGNLSI